MSVLSLGVAIVCALLFACSGAVVALIVRRAFFATWKGSEAIVVVVLVWICWALALGQLLGAVGLLRRGALLVTALATAAIAVAAARRLRPDAAAAPRAIEEPDPPEPRRGSRVAGHALVGATALLVLLVAAIWVTRTVIAVHRGINDPDSLGYHLPFATTFVQSGYADQHRFVLPYLPVHFYPANDELLQAIALALTHSVAFAAVKNLVFGAFVLVAAHAIGKRYGAGLATVAGAAIVLGLPVIAFSQPGEGVNDALLLLVLVGGLALLAHARDHPAPYLLTLAATGVAVGIKFSAVFPAVALAIFAVVLLAARVPAHRVRWAGLGVQAALATGGSWYLRNAITFGNPVPPARIHLGPIHLRQITTATGLKSFSVLGYVVHGTYLRQFRHGLALGLGSFVVVLLAAWFLGVVAVLWSRDGFRRGLGVCALVAAVGYMATPASAWGLDGPAHNVGAFVINLHYAATALAFGMIAVALVLGRSRLAWLFPAIGVVVVVTGIRPGQRVAFWSPEIGGAGFGWLLVAAFAGAAVLLLARWPTGRRAAVAGMVGAALVALVGVALVARRYPSQPDTDPVQQWAAHNPGARVAAWVPDVALLYGPGSPNRVVTLTQMAAHAPVPLASCPVWMATVIAGHYTYSAALPLTAWHVWLASDPAFKLVAQDQLAVVYQVVGQPNINCR